MRTTDDGAVYVEDGRAEMRYSPDDGAKVYRANPANLTVGGEAAKPAKAKPKKASNGTASVDDAIWASPEGERVIGTAVPAELVGMVSTPPGVVDAWTDGACTGNPGPSGYGTILLFDGQYREISQYIGTGTNNIAELLAIYVALEELRGVAGKIRIHTDSSYSIGVLTKGWKAKKNVELIGAIRALIKELDTLPQFVKVAGHAGIPLNERADFLAVSAVARRQ